MKKAFTLVELLAIVVVLSGIFTMVLPQINKTLPTVLVTSIVTNNSFNNKYARNGSVVTLSVEFNKNIVNVPTITIGGREATVTGSGTTWTATYTIPSNETTLTEGILQIMISDYIV